MSPAIVESVNCQSDRSSIDRNCARHPDAKRWQLKSGSEPLRRHKLFVVLRPAELIRRELQSIQLPQPAMSFLKKKTKMSHGPEPAEELSVRVHVGEGDPQYDSVFVLPASHLTRPRLAPLVAMAEQGGDGYVIRIKCQLSDFAQAMALTAVEEAAEGRTAWGRVLVSDARSRRRQTREALVRWMLDPASCDASILEQALTGDAAIDSADLRAAIDSADLRAAAAAVISDRKTSKAKSTKSLAARISEWLRDYMATPKPTTPPPCATSFRPTWALMNRRQSQSQEASFE